MPLKKHTENHVLGAGEVYIDPDGEGFRYLGDTPSFAFSMTSETLDFWKSDTAVAEKAEEVVTQIDRQGNINLRDISPENLSLFLVGTASTTSQSAATGSSETLSSVKLGRIYSIGKTDSNPAGARKLSNVSVTGPSATPTYVEGTDYEIDLVNGLIQLLESGSIPDASDVTVNYDVAAVDWDHIESGNLAKMEVEVLFKSNNRNGDETNYYLPKVELAPDGDLNLQSTEDWASMSFAMTILKPDTQEAIYADGAPYTP